VQVHGFLARNPLILRSQTVHVHGLRFWEMPRRPIFAAKFAAKTPSIRVGGWAGGERSPQTARPPKPTRAAPARRWLIRLSRASNRVASTLPSKPL
jgi:hypothetical protein